MLATARLVTCLQISCPRNYKILNLRYFLCFLEYKYIFFYHHSENATSCTGSTHLQLSQVLASGQEISRLTISHPDFIIIHIHMSVARLALTLTKPGRGLGVCPFPVCRRAAMLFEGAESLAPTCT